MSVRSAWARADKVLEREAWGVAAATLFLLSIVQWWVANRYWRPDAVAEIRIARAFALALAVAGVASLAFFGARFAPFSRHLPISLPLLLRWTLGASIMVVGALAVLLVFIAGGRFECSQDACPGYGALLLDALHVISGVLLMLAGLNLFPRRGGAREAAATPSR